MVNTINPLELQTSEDNRKSCHKARLMVKCKKSLGGTEMKNIIKDLKSMITILVTVNVIFLVDYVAITGTSIDSPAFLLFSNLATMTFTYYFTKKKYEEEGK